MNAADHNFRGPEKLLASSGASTHARRFTDCVRHAKAAPFKRNDQLLEALPISVVVFPGSGVTDNLADKARKLGIPPRRRRSSARWWSSTGSS
jgi:hypothetical protein